MRAILTPMGYTGMTQAEQNLLVGARVSSSLMPLSRVKTLL
jgi:hypothetical protein